MIHSYNKDFLPIIQDKIGDMFNIGVNFEKYDIDEMAAVFAETSTSKQIEKANPIFILGKSSVELLALELNTKPRTIETNDYATPEYWAGYVLAYAQWYFNTSFKALIEALPLSKLILNYFPYHEMDISKTIDLYKNYIKIPNKLKILRNNKNMTQEALAILSGVPIRNIRAYEQGTNDLAKASGETLYYISKALDCTIEDLLV